MGEKKSESEGQVEGVGEEAGSIGKAEGWAVRKTD